MQAGIPAARWQVLRAGQKNTFGIANIRQSILTADSFSIIATRWLVIFAGRKVRSLPALARHCFPEYRQHAENVLHLPLMYRRTSTLAWLLPRDLWSKKARTVQVRAFFCVSCTRQPAPLPVVMVMVVMVVVLMRFMDVVYSVIFICLSCIPILVKVSARLSQ